eukprot:767894-Hanusia_phi.AAC.7
MSGEWFRWKWRRDRERERREHEQIEKSEQPRKDDFLDRVAYQVCLELLKLPTAEAQEGLRSSTNTLRNRSNRAKAGATPGDDQSMQYLNRAKANRSSKRKVSLPVLCAYLAFAVCALLLLTFLGVGQVTASAILRGGSSNSAMSKEAAGAGGHHNISSFSFEVFGKVQGVFFRYLFASSAPSPQLRARKHTQKKAVELQLTGWVANTDRGTVVGEVAPGPLSLLLVTAIAG